MTQSDRGSAISKIIGSNLQRLSDQGQPFEPQAKMWVYEEMIAGRKLTDIINSEHENVKYLPGIKLPPNIVAEPDLVAAAKDATLLVFVVPHQFVHGICRSLLGNVHPHARAISLIKGVDVERQRGLHLISSVIKEGLGGEMDVSVLMGANLANEVAQEQFSEATIGCYNDANGEIFRQLLNTSYFRIRVIHDVHGVELCGALKNVVALGAGFVDGLGMGENTKAAVIRIGLDEMRRFCQLCHESVRDQTFFESCGVADLITTCYGGRNRRVAEAKVRTGKPIDVLEAEMLNGQKLQGPPTAMEIFNFLAAQGLEKDFPLFTAIYRICHENLPPEHIVKDI